MTNDEFSKIRSPLALVAHREIAGEMGGATVHCVVLADGFILDCGTGLGSERAKRLAEAINAFGAEKFQELWRPQK